MTDTEHPGERALLHRDVTRARAPLSQWSNCSPGLRADNHVHDNTVCLFTVGNATCLFQLFFNIKTYTEEIGRAARDAGFESPRRHS